MDVYKKDNSGNIVYQKNENNEFVYETDANGDYVRDENNQLVKIPVVAKVVPIIKVGDGAKTWANLPQAEGVFEQPITLTTNFGYFNGVSGFKKFDGTNGTVDTTGMTATQFLEAALKKAVNPTVGTKVSAGFNSTNTKCTFDDNEIGSYLTGFAFQGDPTLGKYKLDDGNGAVVTTDSGIEYGDFSWDITVTPVKSDVELSYDNSITSTAENVTNAKGSVTGTFTIPSTKVDGTSNFIQITSESNTKYATISATVDLSLTNVDTPKNNLGEDYAAAKIQGFDGGTSTTKTVTNKDVYVTGYRKPFWGWKFTTDRAFLDTPSALPEASVTTANAALAVAADITAAQIRALQNSGTATAGLPANNGTITVPYGAKQIFFAAKAGTYGTLTLTDYTNPSATAPIACTKYASHVRVKGANNFVPSNATGDALNGEAYDLWIAEYATYFGDKGKSTVVKLNWS
jgi:hypothetical protein